jgi:hypothetical protein
VLVFFGLYLKTNSNYNTIFTDLRIEYSNLDDTPKSDKPNEPIYVTYFPEKKAYLLPEYLKKYRKYISSENHKAESIKKDLGKEGITPINKKPQYPEDIGLYAKLNGELDRIPNDLKAEQITKLLEIEKKGVFKHLQIAFIYPCYVPRFAQQRSFPPNNVLLLDWKNSTACAPPKGYFQLYRYQILRHEIFRKKKPMKLKDWALSLGLKYNTVPAHINDLFSLDIAP